MSATVADIPWLAAYAAQRGLRYAREPDERWMRAWEPYATLRVPVRYEHALETTGELGSLTIARFAVEATRWTPPGPVRAEASAWIAIVQDLRAERRVAASSDAAGVFGEPLDLVPLPRRPTGDATYDRAFACFAETAEDLTAVVTPSLRRLTLSWQTPVHFEVRAGGFLVAPVALRADPESLSWLLRAVAAFGERLSKRTADPPAHKPLC